MTTRSHRTHPCTQCPWRTDADQSAFSDEDMAKLLHANGIAGVEAALGAPAMACHVDQPSTAHPMRLCAGWLAVVGPHHLGVRMDMISGRLPESAVVAGPTWPQLHRDFNDLMAARAKNSVRPECNPTNVQGRRHKP